MSTFDKFRYPASSLTNSKVLFISQPATPGLPRIPSTSKEVDKARGQLDQRDISSALYQGSEATVATIINSLEHFSFLHLACHASQNIGDSLESAIHLHDGPLKLSAIIQKSLPAAELAFLSACQTSTGDENLPEEAVHLAAGMLAAGYRGVVATMWSIFDKHAPQIAEDFYQNLSIDSSSEEGARLDVASAARALHIATQHLRITLGDSDGALLAWIPYVHYGI